jgi:histone H3/H4
MISQVDFSNLCIAAGADSVSSDALAQFQTNAEAWLNNTVQSAMTNMRNQGRVVVEAGDLPSVGL